MLHKQYCSSWKLSEKKILIGLIQILSLYCTQTTSAKMMHNHFMFVKVYEVYTFSLCIDKKLPSGFVLKRHNY